MCVWAMSDKGKDCYLGKFCNVAIAIWKGKCHEEFGEGFGVG
jgi:hypothetical protein